MRRTGLHRLSCWDCDISLYQTIPQLERGEMPRSCWACGGTISPDRLEVASLIMDADILEDHPMMRAYRRELDRVMHGQSSHGIRGRKLRPADEIALERILKAEGEVSRERKLSGLKQVSRAREEADAIPF
jgi:hypothetical protein